MIKKLAPLRVDIVTIFPEMIEPYLCGSILGRAQMAGHLDLRTHQLRTWTNDPHKTVDDKPFGGGPGMVMKVEPIHRALTALKLRKKDGTPYKLSKMTRIILTSAKGKIFTQQDAQRLSAYDRLVFICGRYEGVDERVATHLVDEELSIGSYVLTGGELPALVMTDAVARLRPGVLGDAASLDDESYKRAEWKEYPQYTRPEIYRLSHTTVWTVPEILLSGDHKKIAQWRDDQASGII